MILGRALLAAACVAWAVAQDPVRLRADVFVLAGPDMAGRATGTEGQDRAARFVADRLKALGLHPLAQPGAHHPYLQAYDLVRWQIHVEGSHLTLGPLVLRLGAGFETNATEAVRGPLAPEGTLRAGAWTLLRVPMDWTETRLSAELRRAREAGVLGILLAPESPRRTPPALKPRLDHLAKARRQPRPAAPGTPLVVLRPGATPPSPLPAALDLEIRADRSLLRGSNVVALLTGRDPQLRGEYLVVSAHHDHLGLEGGVLHPGADDNASGTAGLLEVARLMAQDPPRRSIIFLSVSGEELGLHGSRAFLAHPPVPLDAMVANLNLDMIGRPPEGSPSVTPARIPGAVGTLTQRARALAAGMGMGLRDEADLYWWRSDHIGFAEQGIPAIFFFGGMHRDYHRATDTPDKLDYPAMARVVDLVIRLARDTANADERPAFLPESAWAGWTWPSPAAGFR